MTSATKPHHLILIASSTIFMPSIPKLRKSELTLSTNLPLSIFPGLLILCFLVVTLRVVRLSIPFFYPSCTSGLPITATTVMNYILLHFRCLKMVRIFSEESYFQKHWILPHQKVFETKLYIHTETLVTMVTILVP